jgi:hypothetical protein
MGDVSAAERKTNLDPLAEVLERFNRKERNLLIRDILNCRDRPLPLAKDFCQRLADAIGIDRGFLEEAWWATDFHFDWLAGALLTFMKGETLRRQDNAHKLIMGNQEDLDLVVVAHAPSTIAPHHLILIEAKAYGYFTNKQWESKVARLERLYAFYKGLESDSDRRIRFHYVLYSPAKPTRLNPKPLPWQPSDTNEPVPIQHVELKLAFQTSSILAVSRCNDKDKLDIKGDFWRCVKLSHATRLTHEDGMVGSSDSLLQPADDN